VRSDLTVLVGAIAAGGVVMGLSWAPMPGAREPAPIAQAHYDDMSLLVGPGGSAPAPAVDVPAEADRRAADREPVAVALPDLGIRSEVIATGLDAGRGVVVPDDVLVTGWYTGSRRLDARRGATVIVGHRDSREQGQGALSSIEELRVGATIRATGRDGTAYDYAVSTVEFVDKTQFAAAAARIFSLHGPHRLTLITCGGAFDEEARSYESNVIVTAYPVADDTTTE